MGEIGQPGRFASDANGGTLFLDEITELPLDLQVKLLRVLETGTFMRVGSMQLQQTDVHIVAASNRDPMQAVALGKLREDLLYRLNVFPIQMPALRDHPEDVTLIAEHFLQDIARREGEVKRFAPQALGRLANYRWPGNVRELEHHARQRKRMAAALEVSLKTLNNRLKDCATVPTDRALELSA